MALVFEKSASVILMGDDLEITGEDGTIRIKVVLTEEAMMALAKTRQKLSRQEKFKVYDRHREHVQSAAQHIYATKGPGKNKRIAIRFLDL